MHALTVLVPADAVEAISERLEEDCAALSVSVEDADAGTPAEQPVFDEPGVPQSGAWQRARITALFADEMAAVSAAASLASARPPCGQPHRGHRTGRRARLGPPDAIAVRADRDRTRLLDRADLVDPRRHRPAGSFASTPEWPSAPAHIRRRACVCAGLRAPQGAEPHRPGRACSTTVAARACSRSPPPCSAQPTCEAVDIDPAAVTATRENANANQVRLEAGEPASVARPLFARRRQHPCDTTQAAGPLACNASRTRRKPRALGHPRTAGRRVDAKPMRPG